MHKSEHCCHEMEYYLNNRPDNNKLAIVYSRRFRRYQIYLKYTSGSQTIHYCPWCGKRFSSGLDDEYDEELAKVLGINIDDITLDTYSDSNIPEEFKSDEWWKKRGL